MDAKEEQQQVEGNLGLDLTEEQIVNIENRLTTIEIISPAKQYQNIRIYKSQINLFHSSLLLQNRIVDRELKKLDADYQQVMAAESKQVNFVSLEKSWLLC